MIRVYEYLDLIPQIVFDSVLVYGEYQEIEEAYRDTIISKLTAQQLTDLVENAIRCADKISKEASIKRLKQRIAKALAEFDPYSAQMDFSNIDGKTTYTFMAEICDTIQTFEYRLNSLCIDFGIEILNGKGHIELSAWESALCWYYEHGQFITNDEEIKQAIEQHKEYLLNPNMKVESYKRKCRTLKHKTDITGISNDSRDNKSVSLDKVISFLKLQELSTIEAEKDRNIYIENMKANKSNK